MINEPENEDDGRINYDANFQIYFNNNNSTYVNGKYWGTVVKSDNGSLNYINIEGRYGGQEQVLLETPKDLYYVNRDMLLGDLTLDGKVGISDAVLLNKIVVGQIYNDAQFKNGDLDGNGKIDLVDSNVLTKFLVHSIEKLPIDGTNKYIIGSNSLGLMDVADSAKSIRFSNSGAIIRLNVPFDIRSYNNVTTVDNKLYLNYTDTNGKTQHVELDNSYYKAEGQYFTLIKKYDDLIDKLPNIDKSQDVQLDFKFGNDYELLTISEKITNTSSKVRGDFNGDGILNYQDYVMLKDYYEGNLKFEAGSYDINVLKDFKDYTQSIYNTADQSTCLYELRKMVIFE